MEPNHVEYTSLVEFTDDVINYILLYPETVVSLVLRKSLTTYHPRNWIRKNVCKQLF